MTTLSDLLPVKPATQLPSTLTESLLATALASDNIDEVKGHLQHTWSHYQALEFALNEVAENVDAIREGLEAAKQAGVTDLDEVAVSARFFATIVLENAYFRAHQVGDFGVPSEALSVPDRLRILFPTLEHGELSSAAQFYKEMLTTDIDEFLASIFPTDEAEGGPNA